MDTPLIEFAEVTKRFGAFTANDKVSFSIPQGSLYGVIGENGAGKSTIMNVLYGIYPPDEGEIRIKGRKVDITSPVVATALGIGMVHQHFMLVPVLTVWENVVLGVEPSFILPKADIVAKLENIQKHFGFSLNLHAKAGTLPVGFQQQVEILKILYRSANILILDEPTAVLTPQEVDTLFERLKALQHEGKTIILISHKLREILAFTDTLTVMRGGKVVETKKTGECNESLLAELIVGRRLSALPPRAAFSHPKPVLQAKNLSVPSAKLKDICFTVNQGEILGVAGVSGNGQDELVEVLGLADHKYLGEVRYLGEELKTKSSYQLKQKGLAVVPSDRIEQALCSEADLSHNLYLGHHWENPVTQKGILQPKKASPFFQSLLKQFDVRPARLETKARALSGGNQQKLVVGRECSRPVSLLIAAYPTRGVDIGAIESIHNLFLSLRQQGTAIVLISSELEEILALSDRIAVLYNGAIIGEVARKDATERQLGLWMTGQTTAEKT